MALNLEDKKTLVAEVAEVAAKASIGGCRRVPWADGRTDDRAACQGADAGRVHACRQEHAGTQGARRHVVRICRTQAQGASRSRFLEGRSGRGRARGEGLREGERQARGDSRIPRRAGTARPRISRRSRACRRVNRRCRCCLASSRRRSQKFVSILDAPPAKLVRTLAAVRDQKQAAVRNRRRLTNLS